MKVKITDIEWDKDGDDFSALPTTAEVGLDELYPTLEDDLSDWISDEVGYCHNGFRYDFVLDESDIAKKKVKAARKVLIDNGIDEDEANTVLQAIGYTLLDVELKNLLED